MFEKCSQQSQSVAYVNLCHIEILTQLTHNLNVEKFRRRLTHICGWKRTFFPLR